MKVGAKFGYWFVLPGMLLGMGIPACLAQNHHSGAGSVPRPGYHQSSRPQKQSASRPESGTRSSSEVQPRYQGEAPSPSPVPRPYRPPIEGRHSGQWLYQHREQPLDQQRRALENDPTFRRLPPQRQQQLEQRLQHFDSLPAERQQQVLRRMETWEHLTSVQKQQFRSMDSEFRGLPADRQRAVRNAIQTLRAMPPAAREQAITSGRFSDFSPQERQILNNAAHLPLAPAQPEAPVTGPNRYVPRPPQ
jgi:Protein of unknown function (DUF3106)